MIEFNRVYIRIGRLIIDLDDLFYRDRQTGECYQIYSSPGYGDYWCRRIRRLCWRVWWVSWPGCLEYKLDSDLKAILTP